MAVITIAAAVPVVVLISAVTSTTAVVKVVDVARTSTEHVVEVRILACMLSLYGRRGVDGLPSFRVR